MRNRIILILIAIGILIIIFWKPPLVINLVIESSNNPKLDMIVRLDGKLIFMDSVLTGTYKRSEIKLANVSNGYHLLDVVTKLGNAEYSKRSFILFRRNIVIEYYQRDRDLEIPYFVFRALYNKFYPD